VSGFVETLLALVALLVTSVLGGEEGGLERVYLITTSASKVSTNPDTHSIHSGLHSYTF
jgi:hypothetical protein